MPNSYYQRKVCIDTRLANTPDALKRSPKTDYTSGYFFVTLNVRGRKPLLGSVVGHYDPTTCQTQGAGVRLSALGEKILQCWQHIPKYHPSVQVIDAQVMPEHFHGLLQITPWTYHYEKDTQPISRPMCIVMNELTRLISGQPDDWWKG